MGPSIRTSPLEGSSQSACGALEPDFDQANEVHEPKKDGLEETNPEGHLGPRRQKIVQQLEEWRNLQVKHNNQDIKSCSLPS